jgi:indolepyruvate ferredoxin oxidoreductase alpha subunit
MAQMGGRGQFIIVGDPGCMVRAQSEPYQLLDVKLSLGSSIGIATGIALGQAGSRKRVVALCGDSGFLHSGLNGLVDAARLAAKLLVIILDNGTTAMSGGQPHAASDVDARGRGQKAVDLEVLARATGVSFVRTVRVEKAVDLKEAIEAGLRSEDIEVIVARGQCPKWLIDGEGGCERGT